jgi:hypothetical protein
MGTGVFSYDPVLVVKLRQAGLPKLHDHPSFAIAF